MKSKSEIQQISFEQWFEKLLTLATSEDGLWLIDSSGKSHMTSYNQGKSPAEEIEELSFTAEWKGCGCGGGI